jgi:hypothetical protein
MAQRSVKVPTRLTRTDRSTEFSAVATATRTHTRRVSRAPQARTTAQTTDAVGRAPVAAEPAPSAKDRTFAPVTITRESVVSGATADKLLAMHLESFAPLAELAIQRQTGDQDEMLEVFHDPAFTKIVAWKQGEPVGLGVITNALDRIPEISPAFLRSRYPEHAARNAIYVGIYVTIAAAHRGVTLFSRISTEMWQIPARENGLLVFDICDFNREVFGADQLALQVASAFPHSNVTTVDRQTWYVAELPEPLPGS